VDGDLFRGRPPHLPLEVAFAGASRGLHGEEGIINRVPGHGWLGTPGTEEVLVSRLVVVAAMVLTACTAPGSPVPVRGHLDPLIGEWSGSYFSSETGRHGSIVFTLRAGQDTATGDVLMVPNRDDLGPSAPRRVEDPLQPTPRLLQINFVRCEGKQVTGWMNPYPDPETGEKTYTTFTGTIQDGTLEGTFVAYLELSGRRSTGTWSVERSKTPPK
jgi:hypothetical protein